MGIYILIGILYILLFGAFYIGFKEFNSFKEDYYKDKNFSFTKFQNLEDFYNKTESQTQNISKLVESYKEDISKVVIEYEKLKISYESYIKDNQEQVEAIKEVYKKDNVMGTYQHLLKLMSEFQTQQTQLESYLSDKEKISRIIEEYEDLKLSYEDYIKDNKNQLEDIKKVYKDDKVMENFHHMLDLMDKFQKDQDSMKSYLSDSIYKLEKYPEKKHIELKRTINVNNSKLKEIESILPRIQGEIVKYQNYFTKELSSIKNVYNNGIK
jgi:hypothetical protein